VSSLLSSFRRALGRPRAVVLVWLVRLLSAWVVASPLTRLLGSFGASHHPRGDAILFEPGGVWLGEALRLSRPFVLSELRGSAFVCVALCFVALVPLAALLEALNDREPLPLSDVVGRGFGRLGSFGLLAGITLAIQGAALALALLGAGALRQRLLSSVDERASDLWALGVIVLGVLVVLLVGVFQDLCRAAIVRDDAGLLAAVRRASSVARHQGAASFGAWAATALVGLGAILLAARLVASLDVARSGQWRVVAVAVVHQLTVVGLIVLRATWLARALALISEAATPASADTPEGSGVPADPSPRPDA
jgi:hypothetical protein